MHVEYRMDWERRPAWNILGTIPGTGSQLQEDAIVLESYYDAMSVVPALAPGAEQAAGITALIELARYFRRHPPPKRTLVFLATSAHHLGLRGIDDFIQRYLRREDPFVDRMLVRRVVDAALARESDRAGRASGTASAAGSSSGRRASCAARRRGTPPWSGGSS